MVDVMPFRAWRYDLGQVGNLSDVTAPPYDVIGPEQQTELYEKHPCNVIRLILNRSEPGDASTDDGPDSQGATRGGLELDRRIPARMVLHVMDRVEVPYDGNGTVDDRRSLE